MNVRSSMFCALVVLLVAACADPVGLSAEATSHRAITGSQRMRAYIATRNAIEVGPTIVH